MMMQMEKFPDQFSDRFFDSPTNYPETEPTTLPIFPNLNSPIQQPNIAPPSILLQSQPHEVASTRHRNNPYPSSSEKRNSMEAMREMIFRIAVMQPIHIDPESVKPPKRRNVKISKDPQSVAARHRRERISERIRILQRLVPGGTKMDTASMLDEAIHYVKFLKKQVQTLEQAGATGPSAVAFNANNNIVNYSAFVKGCQLPPMLGSIQMLS